MGLERKYSNTGKEWGSANLLNLLLKFSLFLHEFGIEFARKRQECFVRLLATDVGSDDDRGIPFRIEPSTTSFELSAQPLTPLF